LSRQKLRALHGSHSTAPADGLRRGGCVLENASKGTPGLILIAGGAEVELIVSAAALLRHYGFDVEKACWRAGGMLKMSGKTYEY